MARLLLYLPALACPLLMLLCMAGMRRMDRSAGQVGQATASTADRIAELERELAALRDEQQRPGLPDGQAAPQPPDPSALGPGIVTSPGRR
jgi:hypothetical protein